VLSGVPQGSVLGSLLFSGSINDISNSMKHCRYFLFGDDIKIFRRVTCTTDCVLQTDIDSFRGWSAANCVKLNNDKSRIITFTRKINAINCNYKLRDTSVIHTNCTKDLE
jgi:hypothetical protein